MNSAYTNLEQSLAAREMGAKQDQWPQMAWVNWHGWGLYYRTRLPEFHNLDEGMKPIEYVAALPWLTDDPQGSGEQSALGLLEALGWVPYRNIARCWVAVKDIGLPTHDKTEPFDSPGALFMACYQKWKEQQAAGMGSTMDTPVARDPAGKGF